jgi:hypothetical protein
VLTEELRGQCRRAGGRQGAAVEGDFPAGVAHLCAQVAAVDFEQALPDNQAQPQKKRQAGIAQTSAEYIAGPTKNLRESQPLVAAWQESRRTGEGSKADSSPLLGAANRRAVLRGGVETA